MSKFAVSHRVVVVNGIDLHIAECGDGPLVVLLHGFPEAWHSWRHQIPALAAAGYHVVAPDLRGYGRSAAPERIEEFTIFDLVGDVIGLVDVLGYGEVIVMGHDWGAAVAGGGACRGRAVGGAVGGRSGPRNVSLRRIGGPELPPIEQYRRDRGDYFYMVMFQEPGMAEQFLGVDVDAGLRATFVSASTRAQVGTDLTDDAEITDGAFALPDWLPADDFARYVETFTDNGFRGPLNWYRNIDRNWRLLAPWDGATIDQPSLYVVGEYDNVHEFFEVPKTLDELRSVAPGARDLVVIPDCSHWTQQEQPEAVTSALLAFLSGVEQEITINKEKS